MSEKLRPEELTAELARLLNRNCAENASNTPDFLLAEFLRECLLALDATIKAREKWYGVSLSPGGLTPAASEPEKVCENCGGVVEWGAPHCWKHPNGPDTFDCQPAPPEPAVRIQTMEEAMEESLRMVRGEPAASCRARKGEPCDYNLGGQCIYCREFTPEPAAPVGEMPEAVHDAIEELRAHALMDGHEGRLERASESNRIGKALESWWRTHAQPVANVAPKKLEKVRELIDGVPWKSLDPRDYSAPLAAALAELDAFERGGREGERK